MQQTHYKGRRIEEHDLNGTHSVHVYFNDADRDRILVPKLDLDDYFPVAQAAAQGYVALKNLGDATDLIDALDNGQIVTLNKLAIKPA